MRVFFFAVVVALMVSAGHAFIAVPRASLVMDPFLIPNFENTTSISSKPQITFYVLNNGTGVANMVNASLVTEQNHVLISAPSRIDAGFTSAFRYELATLLCAQEAFAEFYFEAWYYPSRNLTFEPLNVTSRVYALNVSDFLFIENIAPQTRSLGVDIAKGEHIAFAVRNTGNQRVTYQLNITHPVTFSVTVRSLSDTYELEELANLTFELGGESTHVWDIEVIPTQLAQDQVLSVDVSSPDCELVNASFDKSLTFFWVREGIITQEIVPDLSGLSFVVLLVAAGLLVSKFYY